MINLMYLVLLALLAMNVSKEILNSFALINNGLVHTNNSFTAKNEITYNQFANALLNDPNKVRPYYDKAQAVKVRSQKMYNYIEVLKKDLIFEVEKKDSIETEGRTGNDTVIKIIDDILHMDKKDDASTPTRFFMKSENIAVPGTKAYEFKDKIKKFKEDLLTFIDPKDRANIRLGLDISNVYSEGEEKEITWENNIFYNNPAVAVIAILTKLQNDVKNAESDIINALFRRIDASSFKFDTLASKVIARSNYVIIGEDYNAEVFLAGFSTTSNPQVWLGDVDTVTNTIKGKIDSTSVKVSSGVGHYTASPSAQGTTKWGGLIRVKDPADPTIIRSYAFKSEYKAAPPSVTVGLDKMNIFYTGVENPVTISAAGFAAEDLIPSLPGGSIIGTKGKYIVRVSKPGKCMVYVSVRTAKGMKPMGKGSEFRVKDVPNPVPEFMGSRGGTISQAQLKQPGSVSAKLDNFEFELKFPVISFNISMTVNGQAVDEVGTGSALNDKQKAMLSKAKKGMKVFIDNVKCKKPDGKIVDIGTIALKVI